MRGTGDDRGDTAPTDQGHHYGLAQRLTGGELPLAAAPARPEMRERETAAPAGTTRERITRLTARLDELGRPAEEVRITRKTLLELPDPQPPATPPPKPPAIRPTRRSWRCAPLRAWQVCEAMDMEIAPKNQHPREAQAAYRARNPGRDRAGLVTRDSELRGRCS